FRHKKYPEYKATRQKMPDELGEQMPKIKELIQLFGIPVLELDGYEADDIMGTIAKKVQDMEIYLVTGDKDFHQLLDENIKIYNPKKAGEEIEIIDINNIRQKIGITPGQVTDYLGLMGDSSDNVPGIPGVGPKTALNLINEFGSIENLLKNKEKIKSARIKNKVEEFSEQAVLSKELVTIDINVPVDVNIESLKYESTYSTELADMFEELEFFTLKNKIFEDAVSEEIKSRQKYHTITTKDELINLIEHIKNTKSCFSFDTETTSENPFSAELVGLSFSVRENEAYYIPVLYPGKEDASLLSRDEIIALVKPVLEDASLGKCGQNLKYDIHILLKYGVTVRGADFDTMVASYLLNPNIRQHNLDAISQRFLNYRKIPTSHLLGTGKKQITMDKVSLEKVSEYACEDADVTLQLKKYLKKELLNVNLLDLFYDLEIPLVEVLAEMEKNGVSLDVSLLNKMSLQFEQELMKLEDAIYSSVGETFNINSPQQLGRILFEKLEIHKELGKRRAKRTKTGYSTDVNELEKYGKHPLIKNLLEYRQLAKLKSTYVDALPQLINPITKRIHTSYNQAVTATGRLSSSNPNLQNIPIRSKLGKEIRRAFVPENNEWFILSADYSQIELRLMADLSGDKRLTEAFIRGEDIHRETASQIFHVSIDDVTNEMRYRAKSINFGIMYGMGIFGLAKELTISPDEAQEFIDAYFINFPDVNRYIIDQIESARTKGFVSTLMGRIRHIPEINSDNQRTRKNAENMAVNTPIQGTAADLIKRAMINIYNRIRQEGLRTKMIIQIHDELVFEVPETEIKTAASLITYEMENALDLSVPVRVDTGVGKNWLEAH
ncbi:DNA polymerase I, partial [bacterium]|nr:DNA polymerase I [bacterium]